MSIVPPPVHAELGALYDQHHGWLHAWLRGKLGNSHDAADLAHDVFLRLLVQEDPSPMREPRAFLTTVAKRVLSNFRRRLRVESVYLESLRALPAHHAPDPEARALAIELLCEIDRRLDSLAPRARRAFLMSQVDEMKQGDIAAALGVSLATVQRDIANAVHACFFG
ncbi:RNA polymerase subunit sigma [Bordetella genomosp. 10]|uniref:RNA polymerase subunit sigma n=1 Tax=Bordetella genomosp. 10 TaxID=1416804 RepID=A0A261SAH9_9BORD|nr:sigma-70 family RNA polymerase sigma factor [Bordetella genomosp. 10]OZI33952.1 RNA polymerase subunit sigma [Bordetella genomosp. 10]